MTESEMPIDESTGADVGGEAAPRRFPKSRVSSVERERMVKEARAITFPVSVRGYDRAAVDRYIQQVNRLIAELEISASPEAAVRHALAEVTEETREILQRAHETADEITSRSRSRADERLQEAEREADELRVAARREAEEATMVAQEEAERVLAGARQEAAELREATVQAVDEMRQAAERESAELRAAAKTEAEERRGMVRREVDELVHAAEARERELADSTDSLWRERRRLIEDMRAVAEQLLAVAEAEARRFPRQPQDDPSSRELPATLEEAVRTRTPARESV